MTFDEQSDSWFTLEGVGKGLLTAAITAIVIGKGIRSMSPEIIDPWIWLILVPIWILAIAGIVLVSFVWLADPARDVRLVVGEPWTRFGLATRALASFTLVFVWLLSFSVWSVSDPDLTLGGKFAISYLATCYCGFLLFLTCLYSPSNHRAVTTYLNHLLPPFGVPLIPIFWLPMVWFSLVQPTHAEDNR